VPRARPDLGEIGKRPVSLDVTRTEAAEAILNLLSAAGANYVIGGDVPTGRKVTAKLKNVPLEEALDALAEAAGLTFGIRGRIIILRPAGWVGVGPPYVALEVPKPPQPPAVRPQPPKAPAPPSPPKPESRADAERSRASTRIELRYVSPTEVIRRLGTQAMPESVSASRAEQVFGGAPRQGRSGPVLPQGLDLLTADEPGNAIIASGSEEAVRQVEQMLRALDRQPAQVQISTSVLSVGAAALDAVRRSVRIPGPAIMGDPRGGTTAESLEPAVADRFMNALKASGAIVLAQPSIVSIDSMPASLEISGGGRTGGSMNLMVQPRINADRSITLNMSFAAAQVGLPSAAVSSPAGATQIVQRLEEGKVLVLTQPALAGRGDRRIVLFVRTNVLPGGAAGGSEKGIDREARP